MESFTAIVLAAGQGKRMNSNIAKQYMTLEGKPVLYYSLKAFEDSDIDEIVLVVGAGDEGFVKQTIVERYNFRKVKHIVCGGEERYESVQRGLKAAHGDYVLIHDAARPMISWEIIAKTMEAVKIYKACIVAVPSKDTVKLADSAGFVESTLPRERTWIIQTPQAFSREMISTAYEKLGDASGITDDAMVVEKATGQRVHLVEGSYLNIKITTPEDIKIASIFLKEIS